MSRYTVRDHPTICTSILFFLLFTTQFPQNLWSQESPFAEFTQEHKLSSTIINAACRYQKENTWFGTENGLINYDGNQYKAYSIDTDDSTSSLFSNAVLSLFVDSTDHVWIGTFDGGLKRFDPSSETLVQYHRSVDDVNRKKAHGIWSIVPDREGRLWLGTNQGLERFDPQTGSFEKYAFTASEQFTQGSKKVRALFQQDDGVLWLGTRQGIFRLDPSRSEMKHFSFKNPSESTEAFRVIPPFWEAWWFRAGGTLLIGLALSGATILRYNKLKRNQVILERTVEERTRELKIALLEAERANETKTVFLANVSHDLRTPLTLILGPLNDLLSKQVGPMNEDAFKHLELIEKNTNRIFHLINDLLDYANIESGCMGPIKKPNDLVGVLRYLHGSFIPLAEKREINFKLIVPQEPISFSFDKDQMERIFTNLLSNAFKYTHTKGTIILEAILETENTVHVTIKDDGVGIPKAKIEYIFDRFYRVSANNHVPGTGIGLSLARELVSLHQGEIKVESEEGKGSAFSVILPLLQDVTEGTTKASRDPGLSYVDSHIKNMMPTLEKYVTGSTSKKEEQLTILIADDDQDVKQYLRLRLQENYKVIDASNGVEALEKTRLFLPDLVICDVMMSQMNGVQFTNLMKSNPEVNYIPIILLTANASSKLPGLELGADEFLLKPVDPEELLLRIDNLLSTRKKLINRLAETGYKINVSKIDITSEDDAFLQKVQDTIESHMYNEAFNVTELAKLLAQSRTTLHRRLNLLLDMTPGELIKELRLQRATQLIKARAGSISDIAFSVGFKSVSHFSNSFSKRFGMTPSTFTAHLSTVEAA